MSSSVLVAMSGGVDSSYAAISLLKQGYNVKGVTFKINDNENTIKSIEDAKYICKKFDIEHIVIDYSIEFKKNVIDYFLNSYRNGKTPNPCVVCNKYIKFGLLNDLRKELNIDYIATGHYVDIECIDNEIYLKKPLESSKDQLYFLSQIDKEVLKYCIFPLGKIKSKQYVRDYLKNMNVSISSKKDSQEICFIPNDDLKKFIKEYIPDKMGIIRDDEKVLGNHSGVFAYTIGQRRGLGISSNTPLFVKNIDVEKNEILLGKEEDLYSNNICIKNINILNEKLLNKKLYGKIRYRTKESEIDKIEFIKDKAIITFKENQKSVTKGQYFVAYSDKYIVFSGEIT